MEDFYETQTCDVGGQIVSLFVVFDSHSGARAAQFEERNLFTNLINHPTHVDVHQNSSSSGNFISCKDSRYGYSELSEKALLLQTLEDYVDAVGGMLVPVQPWSRLAFVSTKSPTNYMANLGRGATSLITRSNGGCNKGYFGVEKDRDVVGSVHAEDSMDKVESKVAVRFGGEVQWFFTP
ncbi:hypothetical protein SUGI_0859850 [Cryptomeria japonica]|nr:hypothetical protein SUGI_0859850 [Cryptomeria japonica]